MAHLQISPMMLGMPTTRIPSMFRRWSLRRKLVVAVSHVPLTAQFTTVALYRCRRWGPVTAATIAVIARAGDGVARARRPRAAHDLAVGSRSAATIATGEDGAAESLAGQVDRSVDLPSVGLRHQPGDSGRRCTSGQVETLRPLTVEPLDDGQLLFGLDAFSGHFKAEGGGHGDDSGNQRGVVRVGAQAVDE
jgi:hypothetical protein